MSLPVVRVQLLNSETGVPISDVDVLTNSTCVSYTNSKKTIDSYRGIEKGSTFNDTPVSEILDNILYPYVAPTIAKLSGNTTGLLDGVDEDTTIYTEACVTVNGFTLNTEIMAGSVEEITFTLKTYDADTSKVDEQQSAVVVIPGQSYLLSFEIPQFVTDRSFEVVVDDGTSVIQSPMITYNFVYPVYTGFCTDEMITDGSLIVTDTANNVFNEMVRINGKMITKYVGAPCNHKAHTVSDPLYSDTELYPFILFPNELNKLRSIRETNDIDITGSFIYNSDLRITTVTGTDTDCQYTVFICRYPYKVGLSAVGEISYVFSEDNSTTDFSGEGTPLLDGFDVLAQVPIDYRTVVEEYPDLSKIGEPYNGLVSYVRQERTFFKYSGGVWSPTNQQVFIDMDPTKGDDDYDLELGGWNDIIINVGNGRVYTKLENRRWELRGCIGTSSGGGEGSEGGGIMGPPGQSATIRVTDTVTGLPGSMAKVENIGTTTEAILKFTIPRGDQGKSATIGIGNVTVGDEPDVKNSGTDTNAVLDFTIPRGPQGLPGDPATVTVGEVKQGDNFDIKNVGSDTNAIFDFTFPQASGVYLDDKSIILHLRTVKVLEED